MDLPSIVSTVRIMVAMAPITVHGEILTGVLQVGQLRFLTAGVTTMDTGIILMAMDTTTHIATDTMTHGAITMDSTTTDSITMDGMVAAIRELSSS
jgi:pyruvate/oxaloacetate carboxyltransferase